MPDLRDRADTLALAGDFENAVPLYRRLVAASPQDAALQRKLADALDAGGATEEAIACYRCRDRRSS
jgi:Flp pilus assembly protein TadD